MQLQSQSQELALYIQGVEEEGKAYVCLFTYITSVVRLEIVRLKSTATFLLAFQHFASRKSLPRIMISDNGSTYLSAADELQLLFESKELMELLGRKGVIWRHRDMEDSISA